MKTIENKTPKPLRVPLPQGKTLHLGPLKSGQIATNAEEHPPLKKLVEDGQIEIYDANNSAVGGTEPGQGSPHAHTTAQGGPGVQGARKGDRGA